MNWIKITERLPERAGFDYICRSKNPCQHEDLNWIVCYFDGKEFSSNHVTHWLEITGPEEDFCEYKLIHDVWGKEFDYYKTSCKKQYTTIREREQYTHCPNCGRKIKEKSK